MKIGTIKDLQDKLLSNFPYVKNHWGSMDFT